MDGMPPNSRTPSQPQHSSSSPRWSDVFADGRERSLVLVFGFAMLAIEVAILGAASFAAERVFAAFFDDGSAFSHYFIREYYRLYSGSSIALFILWRGFSGDYSLGRFQKTQRRNLSVILTWVAICAFDLLMMSINLAAHQMNIILPLLFAGLGAVGLVIWRSVLRLAVGTRSDLAKNTSRKVFLVGFQEDIDTFRALTIQQKVLMRVVGHTVLRRTVMPALQQEDLALASATISFLKPDDVIVLLPLKDQNYLENAVNALRDIPAKLYLWPTHAPRNEHAHSVSMVRISPARQTAAEAQQRRFYTVEKELIVGRNIGL